MLWYTLIPLIPEATVRVERGHSPFEMTASIKSWFWLPKAEFLAREK